MSMFITVEGGEGGGKSTNLAFIEKYLIEQGKDV
ncbi:MAG: dTMP kinase, partial [Gammaproteobacteria bacterium]|nr:dTMP kinase [Gammaproteobacteria bacterium]